MARANPSEQHGDEALAPSTTTRPRTRSRSDFPNADTVARPAGSAAVNGATRAATATRPLEEPMQEPLTVVAAVKRARLPELQALLAEMAKDPGNNRILPFAQLPRCHFGRVLVWDLPRDLDGRVLDPMLILIGDCDGSADDFLEDLVDVMGSRMDTLFGPCVAYPSLPLTRAERVDFLVRHRVATPANYIHRPGRTVEQIKGEAQLRDALQAFLATASFKGQSALVVREKIIEFVKSTPSLRFALEEPQRFSLEFHVRELLSALAGPAALLSLSPLLLPAIAAVLVALRIQEETAPCPHIRPSPELVQELARLEDHGAQNGFTAAGQLKPGLLRQITLGSVLQLIGYGARYLFTRDSLAGVTTIHFARWIPLDGGRRVIFASNYDGSLEAYNDDFIDLVWWGLNLVFGNGYEYPKTRWLIFGGSKREQEFKDYLRRHQVPTPVWYSAYPQLTTANVQNNAAIRRGLRGRMNEREAQAWLRRL